jgi:serine/threonine-protein kinase
MGEVWLTQHMATDREFAIKFMHATQTTSSTARERFSREARASARINHPNIVDVYDVGELEDGALYLVMEVLDGIPLDDAFYLTPPLTVRDFLSLMLDTARALAAAHAVGIIHRDIKPANVYLHRDRATGLASAKLLDFGISKFTGGDEMGATKTGSVLGSPRYMAPEQALSASGTDQRADLWACGVILFEGTTGTWPHDAETFPALVLAITTKPPASIDALGPHLPEDLRSIVRDCLQPVEHRIASATELAARLEACLQNPALERMTLARPLRPPGDGRSFTTGGHLRVRLAAPSVSLGDSITNVRPKVPAEALNTAQNAFGLDASKPSTRPMTPEEAGLGIARTVPANAFDAASVRAAALAMSQQAQALSQQAPPTEPGVPSELLETAVAGPGTRPLGGAGGAFATQEMGVPTAPRFGSALPTPEPPAAIGPTLLSGHNAPGAGPVTMPEAVAVNPFETAAPHARPGWDPSLRTVDPLTGSVSSAVSTLAIPPPATGSGIAVPAGALNTLPSTRQPASAHAQKFGGPLGIAAAVLAVLAVGIGVALVSAIGGSGDAQIDPTARPADDVRQAATTAPATAAPPATETPTASAEPTAAATASAAPTASATAVATPTPPNAPRRPGVPPPPTKPTAKATAGAKPSPPTKPGGTKIEQLGSGL